MKGYLSTMTLWYGSLLGSLAAAYYGHKWTATALMTVNAVPIGYMFARLAHRGHLTNDMLDVVVVPSLFSVVQIYTCNYMLLSD